MEAKQFIEDSQQIEDEFEFLCLEVEYLQIMKDFFENQAKLFNDLIYNQEVKDFEILKEEQELTDKFKQRQEDIKKLDLILRTTIRSQNSYNGSKKMIFEEQSKSDKILVPQKSHTKAEGEVKNSLIRKNGFFHCTECPYKTKWFCILKSHINAVHRKLRPWNCSDCVKAFVARKDLISHQQCIHTMKRDWTCDRCGSQFATKNGLRIHMKNHLPPSFACSKCDKKFVRVDAFKNHLKLHEGILNEICKHCKKGYTNKNSLSTHIIYQHFSKLHCEIPGCSITFVLKSSYRIHLKNVHKKLDKNLIGKLLEKLPKLKPDFKQLKYV